MLLGLGMAKRRLLKSRREELSLDTHTAVPIHVGMRLPAEQVRGQGRHPLGPDASLRTLALAPHSVSSGPVHKASGLSLIHISEPTRLS